MGSALGLGCCGLLLLFAACDHDGEPRPSVLESPLTLPVGTQLEISFEDSPRDYPWDSWPSAESVRGAPGWKQSSQPVCEDAFEPQGHAVWSDERGVFLLARRGCNPYVLERSCLGDGTSVWFNDGSGWTRYFQPDLELVTRTLSGIPGGEVYLVGPAPGIGTPTDELPAQRTCDLLSLNAADEPSCALPTPPDGAVQSVQVVASSPDRAFVLRGREVWSLADGDATLLHTLSREGTAIWADERRVAVAVPNALFVLGPDDEQFVPLPRTPAGYYMALWGDGEEGLWAANDRGHLIRWDGSGWHMLESGAVDGIEQLWGSEGVLFFRSWTTFGRVINGEAEILFSSYPKTGEEGIWPREHLSSMWGNSPTEVFVVIESGRAPHASCPQQPVVHWFDGSSLHRF